MSESIKIRGVQDELEIFEFKIVITPKGLTGFLNKGLKGSKEIPFSSITAIQFKEAGSITNGYIQFSMSGGSESKGGIWSALKDENTFMFKRSENEEMKRAKQFLESRIYKKDEQKSSPSLADEITKLSKLQTEGAITPEEFATMKANLIKKAS